MGGKTKVINIRAVNLYSLLWNKHNFFKVYKLLPLMEDDGTVVKLLSGSVGRQNPELYHSGVAGIDTADSR
ncbi:MULTISPECIES: hypothetical protein [unclassified Microcoleus]|uniref:hypothetical protein n=1 Tax=unclassified Microcoleus TaxID=2642155 RepID=UPI002FD74545